MTLKKFVATLKPDDAGVTRVWPIQAYNFFDAGNIVEAYGLLYEAEGLEDTDIQAVEARLRASGHAVRRFHPDED